MKYSYCSKVGACARAAVGVYVVYVERRAPWWGYQGANWEADFEVIGAWWGEVVLEWPTEVGETYVEDGVVGAWGRTNQGEVAHRDLLNTNDTCI